MLIVKFSFLELYPQTFILLLLLQKLSAKFVLSFEGKIKSVAVDSYGASIAFTYEFTQNDETNDRIKIIKSIKKYPPIWNPATQNVCKSIEKIILKENREDTGRW